MRRLLLYGIFALSGGALFAGPPRACADDAPPAPAAGAAAAPTTEPAAVTEPAAAAGALTPPDMLERYAPTLPVLVYAAEVPGAQGIRTAHQIGVLVGKDGLVMMPGHLQALNTKVSNLKTTIEGEPYDGDLLERVGDLNVSYVQLRPAAGAKTAQAGDEAKSKPPALDAVTFPEHAEVRVGDPVWVFGILPEQAGYALRLTRYRVIAELDEPSTVYVLDSPTNPGEAGGLVLDAAGRPLGVVGYELSPQQGGEVYVRYGLPLLFPAETLRESMAQPRGREAPSGPGQAWFGILIQPVTRDLALYFENPDLTGCIVSNVVRGSPAEAAGLRRGDIITEYQGKPLDIPNDLAVLSFTREIRNEPIGSTVSLKYLRDGQVHEAAVTLAERPKTTAKAEALEQPAWGLTVRELTNDVIYLLNLPPDLTGVVVAHVEEGGPGQAAGLRPGDVLLRLNGQDILDLADYEESTDQLASARPEKVILFVRRGSQTSFTTLEPDWSLPAKK